MKSLWSRFRRHVAGALAVAIAVLVGCEAICQGKLPYDPYGKISVDQAVEIKIVGTRIKLYPMVTVMRRGGEFEFVVRDLPANHSLEIDYKVENVSIVGEPGTACDDPSQGQPVQKSVKGPFSRYENQPRGRLVLTASGTRKVKYDACHTDAIVWKYEIALRDGNGKDVDVVDPVTVGKGEG